MTEFFEDNGTWAGLPVSVQGIFEDGECIAIKVLDRITGDPISWAFDPGTSRHGPNTSAKEGFRKLIQRLYDEQKEK